MKQALVVVDIQNDYFPGGRIPLFDMETAAANAKRILELFRARNLPIFHIQHISNREGAAFFLPGTDGAEIHASAAPVGAEPVLQKNFPNAFRSTALNEELRRIDIKKIIVIGAMTHMCIDTTVRAAFDLGFNCTVVSDACTTRGLEFGGVKIEAPQVHAAFMAALSAPFARIIMANELENNLT